MSIQTRESKNKKTGKTTKMYRAAVYDPIAKKAVWSEGFPTRKEAKIEEARMIRELERHSIAKSKCYFSEAAEECFASRKAKWAYNTFKAYKGIYANYIAPIFADREIHAITTRHVQNSINEMNERYAPETVNKTRNLLKMMFQYAIGIMGCNIDNPCAKVKGAKVAKPHHLDKGRDRLLSRLRASESLDLLRTAGAVGTDRGQTRGSVRG
jgi:hypothetical protein